MAIDIIYKGTKLILILDKGKPLSTSQKDALRGHSGELFTFTTLEEALEFVESAELLS